MLNTYTALTAHAQLHTRAVKAGHVSAGTVFETLCIVIAFLANETLKP